MAALSGMTIAAVDLGDSGAVARLHAHGRADRGQRRSCDPVDDRGCVRACRGKAEVEQQEVARVRRGVAEELRAVPLIGDREVEAAIAIDVGGGDAARDAVRVYTDFARDVVKAAARIADEEGIAVVAAQIDARLELRPSA